MVTQPLPRIFDAISQICRDDESNSRESIIM